MADAPTRTAATQRRKAAAARAAGGSNRPPTEPGSMMKMYTDDAPGIKMFQD